MPIIPGGAGAARLGLDGPGPLLSLRTSGPDLTLIKTLLDYLTYSEND